MFIIKMSAKFWDACANCVIAGGTVVLMGVGWTAGSKIGAVCGFGNSLASADNEKPPNPGAFMEKGIYGAVIGGVLGAIGGYMIARQTILKSFYAKHS